jgi:predicted HicB family RNase H-like nuclease
MKIVRLFSNSKPKLKPLIEENSVVSKPKPDEPLDSFMVRPPRSVGEEVRRLAEEQGLSLNEYAVAIFSECAKKGTIVHKEYSVRNPDDR